MKNIFLASLLFSVLSISFFSCKKADTQASSASSYYIKGKKDGVAFNFTTNAQATSMATGGVYMLNLIAGSNTSEGFNIGINSSSAIATGIYSEDNSSNYVVLGMYNPNSTTMVYAAGIQSSVKPLVINILTKTSTEVTGTFSGAFYRQSTTGTFYSDYITITEGEFKLQIK